MAEPCTDADTTCVARLCRGSLLGVFIWGEGGPWKRLLHCSTVTELYSGVGMGSVLVLAAKCGLRTGIPSTGSTAHTIQECKHVHAERTGCTEHTEHPCSKEVSAKVYDTKQNLTQRNWASVRPGPVAGQRYTLSPPQWCYGPFPWVQAKVSHVLQ